MFPIYERATLLGSFSGFPHLSFWYEQLVGEGEYGVLVKLYSREKTEVLGEKPVPVTLCSSQISHGLA